MGLQQKSAGEPVVLNLDDFVPIRCDQSPKQNWDFKS
jgi:hypothetical protein